MKDCLKAELIKDNSVLEIQIPKPLRSSYARFEEIIKKEFDGWRQVSQKKPNRPRSTGERSQNHCIRGWCKDLAIQAKKPFFQDPDNMYKTIILLAVDAGIWPYFTTPLNPTLKIPQSEADASMEDDRKLLDFIQKIADEKNYWLTIYSEDGEYKYRSIGGRTLDEMNKIWPELNKDLTP